MSNLTMSRRSFLTVCAALGLSAAFGTSATGCSNGATTFIYSGSWNEKGGNPGLFLHTYDEKMGKIGEAQKQAEISVGFILPDYDRKLLYVTQEADNLYDKGKELNAGMGGSIYVYSIDEKTGALTEVQASPSYGSNPSMVSFSPDKKFLLCSIHTAKSSPCHAIKNDDGAWEIRPAMPSPNVVCFPIADDGTLGNPTDIMTFEWEPGCHVSQLHTVTWAPDGSFFLVADKGTSWLYSMTLSDDGKLKLVSTNKELGASARYVRFSPDSKYVYVNSESANEVAAYSVGEGGELTRIGEGEVVPAEIRNAIPKKAKFEQQDMKLNEDGTFLYDVVRGSNDDKSQAADNFGDKVHGEEEGQFQGVSVLKIDQSTHLPERVQYLDLASEEGWWPRGIALTPSEDAVVIASLYGDKLIRIPIKKDGTLDDSKIESTPQDTAANLTFYAPGA